MHLHGASYKKFKEALRQLPSGPALQFKEILAIGKYRIKTMRKRKKWGMKYSLPSNLPQRKRLQRDGTYFVEGRSLKGLFAHEIAETVINQFGIAGFL